MAHDPARLSDPQRDRSLRGSPLAETTESENDHVSPAERSDSSSSISSMKKGWRWPIRSPRFDPPAEAAAPPPQGRPGCNLFAVITKARDRAMFMLMLRSGLRVEEVAHLTVDAVEYQRRQLFVASGKGAKDRMVYLSDDASSALVAYLEKRSSKAKGAVPGREGTDDKGNRSPYGASRRGSNTMRERAD